MWKAYVLWLQSLSYQQLVETRTRLDLAKLCAVAAGDRGLQAAIDSKRRLVVREIRLRGEQLSLLEPPEA